MKQEIWHEYTAQEKNPKTISQYTLEIFCLWKVVAISLHVFKMLLSFFFLFYHFQSSFYISSFGFKCLVNNFKKATPCFIFFFFYPKHNYLQSHLAFASSSGAKIVLHSLAATERWAVHEKIHFLGGY